ncbi:alpha/beta fold hydrolase [Sphingomonas glacialis]|uniref:Alpha/beta fold hydrolase n=1 Tax=Sphingomonas glacialis TaxID=658225 RepID=A0A502FFJ2_9SPHN|nr:alpha/beta fold hydrolase [Sphingomonas glacialis]
MRGGLDVRENILFLPGLLCDEVVWRHQTAALGARYDVVVARLTDFASITAMAQAALALAPGSLSVVGHSMGARVALEMVRLAPDRIARLALLDTGVHPVGAAEPGRRQQMIDLAETKGMAALADRWLPPMVMAGALERDPALDATLRAMVERMSPEIHGRQIAALLGRRDAAPLLATIRCPVLVGVGRHDAWSPPEQHAAIVAAIPRARYVIFEESGHMAPMEAPEAVTAALSEWMLQSAGETV